MNTKELTSPSAVLFNCVEELKDSMNQVTPDSFSNIETYEIDCNLLPSFEDGFLSSKDTETLLRTLEKSNTLPAVYWFEIVSDHTAKIIYDPYPAIKRESIRSLPAFKIGFKNWDSKILYVGKVKNNISGRMFVHLGYHAKVTYQGLHLCHWSHLTGLKLRLNIIYLPQNLGILTSVFEMQLAASLNPILGKHK